MPDIEIAKSSKERESLGRNCALRMTFLRHANKTEFDPHAGGKISQSGLSEKGKTNSREYGRQVSAEDISRIDASSMGRNLETVEHITLGSFDRESSPPPVTTEIYNELAAPHFSKDFIEKEYRPRFDQKPENYDSLPPDEQEKIAEAIEEPAVNYWIGLWDKKYDEETESAREVAERVAYYFLSEPDKLIETMQSGEKEEILLGITHKTATEPFLLYCKELPKDLKELGGSLNLMEGWTIEIATDSDGKKSYKIFLRGKEYSLNLERVNELAKAYEEKKEKNNK